MTPRAAYPFAPDAIERHRRPRWGSREQRRALLRWLLMALGFMTVCSLGGFAVGLISGALK